jgi:hypothetical protein
MKSLLIAVATSALCLLMILSAMLFLFLIGVVEL